MNSQTNVIETITSGTLSATSCPPASSKMRNRLYEVIRTSPPNRFRTIREVFGTLKTFIGDNVVYYNAQDEVIKVECITANSERAVAEKLHKRNRVLPIISVKVTEVDLDTDRQKYGPLIVWDTIWNDEIKRAQRIVREVPKQVYVQIELNIWAKYQEDLGQLSEAIEFLFRPNLCLKTRNANNTKYFLESSSNISEVNLKDGEARTLKKVYSIRCESYIYGKSYMITNTGEIEEINFDFEVDV